MESDSERIERSLLSDVPVQRFDNYFKIESQHTDLTEIKFEFQPDKIIFPAREGELIENPYRLGVGEEYSLSYPGTASTKCIVLFQDAVNIFIGGRPAYDYTKITLKRIDDKIFHISFTSKNHEYYLIPFKKQWQDAADIYKECIGIEQQAEPPRKPKYLLQLGVRNPYGQVNIKHFDELYTAINLFHEYFGEGNIIHFFGTSQAGHDRLFPDYTIDPTLGGEKSLSNLLKRAQALKLLTSHHYNPRIADSTWMKLNPGYRSAIVKKNGQEVIEPYAGQPHFVMNPNNEKWFARCFETVKYLADVGFDYLEIDQFTYQRNFYNNGTALALGYKKIVDKFIQMGLKFWVEGVSDIFRLPEGDFYQILIRDRSQLWEDCENRRGYPYGKSYAEFFMYLWPDSEVSYQIFTENKAFDLVKERFESARKINTAIYDMELGYYDGDYLPNLKKLIRILF